MPWQSPEGEGNHAVPRARSTAPTLAKRGVAFRAHVAACLSERAEQISPDVAERLRFAGKALEIARRTRRCPGMGSRGGRGDRWFSHVRWCSLRLFLPMVRVVGGLVLIQNCRAGQDFGRGRDREAPSGRRPAINAYRDRVSEFLKAPPANDSRDAVRGRVRSLPCPRRARSLAVPVSLAALCRADGVLAQGSVPPRVDRAERRVAGRAEPGPAEALAPLERAGRRIDAARKQKWIALAGRFRRCSGRRARITARWPSGQGSPGQRGQRACVRGSATVAGPDRGAGAGIQGPPPESARKRRCPAGRSRALRATPPSRPGSRREARSQGTTSSPTRRVAARVRSRRRWSRRARATRR